jgi:hypothetical protein
MTAIAATKCPSCGRDYWTPVPPEPPVGTWMRDRFGGITYHQPAGWGEAGVLPLGQWDAMWAARGPYVECEPWGRA